MLKRRRHSMSACSSLELLLHLGQYSLHMCKQPPICNGLHGFNRTVLLPVARICT